jgi:hypothetical protein
MRKPHLKLDQLVEEEMKRFVKLHSIGLISTFTLHDHITGERKSITSRLKEELMRTTLYWLI